MDDEKWFPRFAEIPGINYIPPKGLDFSHLTDRGKVPEISYYDFDGKKRKSVMWNYGETSSSASPAKQWETVPRPSETEATTILRQVYEILELPGTLSDYHFALQNAHGELSSYASEEHWVLPQVERLCWLNIDLMEKYPETISYENDEGIHFARVTAFGSLLGMYKNEGFLYEALKVARIAVKFDYQNDLVEEIEERIRHLQKEDSYA